MDNSWTTVRPVFTGQDHNQLFGTGGPDDMGSGPTLPGGNVDVIQEESLALQGLGENRLDVPISERPGGWHNADHSFNETQFKHGRLDTEVEDEGGDSVIKVDTLQDGTVSDYYVHGIRPEDPTHVAQIVKSIAGRAYNGGSKQGQGKKDMNQSKEKLPYNPFGGVRNRIIENRRQLNRTTAQPKGTKPWTVGDNQQKESGKDAKGGGGKSKKHDGGTQEDDAFMRAVKADNIEHYYEQAKTPDETADEKKLMQAKEDLGLRRISIREQQSTLMQRVGQRLDATDFVNDYQGSLAKQVEEDQVISRRGALTNDERHEMLAEVRGVAGSQYTASQEGLGTLSHEQSRKFKKSKKLGYFKHNVGVGV